MKPGRNIPFVTEIIYKNIKNKYNKKSQGLYAENRSILVKDMSRFEHTELPWWSSG